MVLLALLMCLFFAGGVALDSYLQGTWGFAPLHFSTHQQSTATPGPSGG